jgi:dTMP kinase
VGQDVDVNWVREVNTWALKPDIVVYLKVDIEVALRRIRERGGRVEFYEKAEELRRVSDMFERAIGLIKEEGVEVITIDEVREGKELSVEEVSGLIFKGISKFLKIS